MKRSMVTPPCQNTEHKPTPVQRGLRQEYAGPMPGATPFLVYSCFLRTVPLSTATLFDGSAIKESVRTGRAIVGRPPGGERTARESAGAGGGSEGQSRIAARSEPTVARAGVVEPRRARQRVDALDGLRSGAAEGACGQFGGDCSRTVREPSGDWTRQARHPSHPTHREPTSRELRSANHGVAPSVPSNPRVARCQSCRTPRSNAHAPRQCGNTIPVLSERRGIMNPAFPCT